MNKIFLTVSAALVAVVMMMSLTTLYRKSAEAACPDCCNPRTCDLAHVQNVVNGSNFTSSFVMSWCYPTGSNPNGGIIDVVGSSAVNISGGDAGVTFTPDSWIISLPCCGFQNISGTGTKSGSPASFSAVSSVSNGAVDCSDVAATGNF
jgi:hypothetical protein